MISPKGRGTVRTCGRSPSPGSGTGPERRRSRRMRSTARTRPAMGSSRPFVVHLFALFLLLVPIGAVAQTPPPAAAPADATVADDAVAELEALVGTLTDDAARAKFVGQLKTDRKSTRLNSSH